MNETVPALCLDRVGFDAPTEAGPLVILNDIDLAIKSGERVAVLGPSRLSGGEQQRGALARALAPRPALLFADEPTGNLDSDSGRAIADLMLSSCADYGTTLVLIIHDEALAARCDRIVRMRDGHIVDGGAA